METELGEVRTWHDVHGSGEPLVYLHGGYTDSRTLDDQDLATVTAPTLVMCSDDDVVTLEHTVAMYRAIPDAQLAVVPGTSHVLVVEKAELVTRLVLDFLDSGPVETMMPIRRSEAES